MSTDEKSSTILKIVDQENEQNSIQPLILVASTFTTLKIVWSFKNEGSCLLTWLNEGKQLTRNFLSIYNEESSIFEAINPSKIKSLVLINPYIEVFEAFFDWIKNDPLTIQSLKLSWDDFVSTCDSHCVNYLLGNYQAKTNSQPSIRDLKNLKIFSIRIPSKWKIGQSFDFSDKLFKDELMHLDNLTKVNIQGPKVTKKTIKALKQKMGPNNQVFVRFRSVKSKVSSFPFESRRNSFIDEEPSEINSVDQMPQTSHNQALDAWLNSCDYSQEQNKRDDHSNLERRQRWKIHKENILIRRGERREERSIRSSSDIKNDFKNDFLID